MTASLFTRLAAIPTAARFATTVVFMVVITALSVLPGVAQPGDTVFVWLVVNTPTLVQKSMHLVVYATLAALWMWTLESIESRMLRMAVTLAASVGLGAGLEWYQTQVSGRFGTLFDVLLNTAGTLLGLLAALFLL